MIITSAYQWLINNPLKYHVLIDDVSKYVAMLCLFIMGNHFLAVSLYHQVTKLRHMGKQWL
jgi:hypothetical protein